MKFLFFFLLFLISHLALADAKLIKPILESNDELFMALLSEDQKLVSVAAEKLSNVISLSKDSKLILIAADLKNISIKKSKTENLASYSKFMEGFLPLAKGHGLGTDHSVYYCPMVKKYWLQNNKVHKKTQNVFAQEMLECGGKA